MTATTPTTASRAAPGSWLLAHVTPPAPERDYRQGFDDLEHLWRTVVLAAEAEATALRTNALTDARRIIADARTGAFVVARGCC